MKLKFIFAILVLVGFLIYSVSNKNQYQKFQDSNPQMYLLAVSFAAIFQQDKTMGGAKEYSQFMKKIHPEENASFYTNFYHYATLHKNKLVKEVSKLVEKNSSPAVVNLFKQRPYLFIILFALAMNADQSSFVLNCHNLGVDRQDRTLCTKLYYSILPFSQVLEKKAASLKI